MFWSKRVQDTDEYKLLERKYELMDDVALTAIKEGKELTRILGEIKDQFGQIERLCLQHKCELSDKILSVLGYRWQTLQEAQQERYSQETK